MSSIDIYSICIKQIDDLNKKYSAPREMSTEEWELGTSGIFSTGTIPSEWLENNTGSFYRSGRLRTVSVSRALPVYCYNPLLKSQVLFVIEYLKKW